MLRLAHEALLAHWPTLATLIRDDFRFLGVRRRLHRAHLVRCDWISALR